MKTVGAVKQCQSNVIRPIQKCHRYPLRSKSITIEPKHPKEKAKSSVTLKTVGEVEQCPYLLRSKSTAIEPKHPIYIIGDINSVNKKVTKKRPKLCHKPFDFLAMNDNCILYVLEHLSLADLCTTADVSVRLKQMAQYYFRLKYRDLDMKLLAEGNNKISMKKVRQLFRHFGHLIKSLRVSRKDFLFNEQSTDRYKGQYQLFRYIRENCTLNSLTLRHFWMNMKMIQKSKSIFETLTTLNFYRLSCYCEKEKKFLHFANAVRMVFEKEGLANCAPLLVQLL